VGNQRNKKNQLSDEQKQRLDDLGFIWDPLADQWDMGIYYLDKFVQIEGNCKVPKNFKLDGFPLGLWVSNKRSQKDKLSSERIKKLDDIGFIWDPLNDLWEEYFKFLVAFKAREGHCRVPINFVDGTIKLGAWVAGLRKSRENLLAIRKIRLNEIGFSWDPITDKWEEGFNYLVKFKEINGHCRVPISFTTNTYKLGAWVNQQRRNRNNLTASHISRLNNLEFIWDPNIKQWEEGFVNLVLFRNREGHCKVKHKHIEGKFSLGTWVGNQRNKKNQLSDEQKQRLDDLGFIWDPLADQWEEGFTHLIMYKLREGNCNVPQKHVEENFPLGAWLSTQRYSREKLFEERFKRLDDLGVSWKSLKDKTRLIPYKKS
jgi:hypothetical protein